MHDINGKTLKINDFFKAQESGNVFQIVAIDEKEKGIVDLKIKENGKIAHSVHLASFSPIRISSLQEMAEEALQVQNACNLSGVVHSFSRLLPGLRMHVEEMCALKGEIFTTEKLSQHPVCVLFATQIAFLTKYDHDEAYTQAYNWAEDNKKS